MVVDAFHVPLVFLADNPGILPGSASEREGVLLSGARDVRRADPRHDAQAPRDAPQGVRVRLPRDVHGRLRWPVRPFAFPGCHARRDGCRASARASGADRSEAEALRLAELDASWRSAEGLGFDEIVDPRELRNVLLPVPEGPSRRQAPAEPVSRTAIMP